MKEVELTFKNGTIEGQLTKGFPEDAEAEDVLRNIMKDVGFKQKTAHRPHHHQPQKKKVVQGIGIR